MVPPPLTPGTNKKMTEALQATFASWEKEGHKFNVPKGNVYNQTNSIDGYLFMIMNYLSYSLIISWYYLILYWKISLNIFYRTWLWRILVTISKPSRTSIKRLVNQLKKLWVSIKTNKNRYIFCNSSINTSIKPYYYKNNLGVLFTKLNFERTYTNKFINILWNII